MNTHRLTVCYLDDTGTERTQTCDYPLSEATLRAAFAALQSGYRWHSLNDLSAMVTL